MDCALWLNRRKICTASEIAEEPDIASLRGYFLAGSLVGWLYEHDGEKYAKKLEKLSTNDPKLNEKLEKIFGGNVGAHKRFGEGAPQSGSTGLSSSSAFPCSFKLGSAGSYRYSEISSFGSFLHNWEFFLGSFRFGSYYFGSGMHEWEWEWLYNLYKSGSFSLGSFASFHEWEWEWLFKMFGSGSFTGGSFGFGSFRRSNGFGSLYMPFVNDFNILDEYDRIMLETLMRCPLDRFGYGIHNI